MGIETLLICPHEAALAHCRGCLLEDDIPGFLLQFELFHPCGDRTRGHDDHLIPCVLHFGYIAREGRYPFQVKAVVLRGEDVASYLYDKPSHFILSRRDETLLMSSFTPLPVAADMAKKSVLLFL